MKPYCKYILNSLLLANMDLDNIQKSIQYYFTLMENNVALNSVDKAKRIIKDSRIEIQSKTNSLYEAMKSMP